MLGRSLYVLFLNVSSFLLVMHDIVGTMFNKRFMEELFKPQDTYSKKAMRTVFDRLAHASIMRLNSASMDKVRGFKYPSYSSSVYHLTQMYM